MEWMYEQIGRRIRVERQRKKFSQERLAQAAELSRASIVNIEHGRQKVMVHSLYAIADVLDIDVCALIPSKDQQDRVKAVLANEDPSVSKFYQMAKQEAVKRG